jgi:hypothetical protein
MTTILENKLNMYLAVRNFMIPNEGVTKDLPNFSANYAILFDTIGKIQAMSEMQKADKKGLAIGKNKLKEKLIETAADYSRKITAYAKFSNNDTLPNETLFSAFELGRMTDVSLKDYLQIIYDKAEENIGKLTEYGITAETQKVLIDTITAYNTSLSKPRTGIAEIRQATKRLSELFDAADDAIEKMDYSVGIIQLTQTDFFNGYRTSRKRVSSGKGYLALQVQVKDQVSGEPVKGVLFKFKVNGTKTGSAGSNGEILKKTADKGIFKIKNMPAGTYNVSVSKPGYKDKEFVVSVADGERSDLNIAIEKE